MKIKSQPDDFIVQEILSCPLESQGQYHIYLLKKRGLNTTETLRKISSKLNIPLASISYGGKKDKHAATSQHIALENPPSSKSQIAEDRYQMDFLGFLNRPMGPDLIQGNRFQITIRDLSAKLLTDAMHELEWITRYGYCNYFDDQRFGSWDEHQGFIAEKIIQEHYNGAVKILLTHISSEDSKDVKERKKSFIQNWGQWSRCHDLAQTPLEKESFNLLTQNPKAFLEILQEIPEEDLSLFFSAYQSHLWNEVLRRLIPTKLPGPFKSHRGLVAPYVFYDTLREDSWAFLRKLSIPTIASRMVFAVPEIEKIYHRLLEERHLRLALFNIRKIRQAYFKSYERTAVVIPENLSWESSSDEIYSEKKKLTLRFFLPRGSYATMLIKRIFAKPSHAA